MRVKVEDLYQQAPIASPVQTVIGACFYIDTVLLDKLELSTYVELQDFLFEAVKRELARRGKNDSR